MRTSAVSPSFCGISLSTSDAMRFAASGFRSSYLGLLFARDRVSRGDDSAAWLVDLDTAETRQAVDVVRAVAGTSSGSACERARYELRNLLCQARAARREAGLRKLGRMIRPTEGGGVFEVIKVAA